MANYFKVNTLVLNKQFLTATGNQLYLDGLLIGSGNFDGFGTAALTGSNLYNLMVNMSGQDAANYATITNLFASGSNLYIDITSLSGYLTGNPTINNLAVTNNLTVGNNTQISGNLTIANPSISEIIIGTGGNNNVSYLYLNGNASVVWVCAPQPILVLSGWTGAYGGGNIIFSKGGIPVVNLGIASALVDPNGISNDFVIYASSGIVLYSNKIQTLYLDTGQNGIFSKNLTISGNHTLFGNYINPSILATGTGISFYFGSNTGMYIWSGAGTGISGQIPTGIMVTGILPTGISGSFPSGTFSGYNFTIKNKSQSGFILISGQIDNNLYSTTINQFIIYPLSSFTFYSDNETWNIM